MCCRLYCKFEAYSSPVVVQRIRILSKKSSKRNAPVKGIILLLLYLQKVRVFFFRWRVRADPSSLNATTFAITRRHIHPKFDARDLASYFDVAVLELEGELELSPVARPVCVPTKGDGYWGKGLDNARITVQGNMTENHIYYVLHLLTCSIIFLQVGEIPEK